MSDNALAATNDVNPSHALKPTLNKPILLRPIGPEDRWKGRLYRPVSDAIKKIGRASQTIRCWLPSSGVSFVRAKRGSGKTLLLLDQALSLATDRDWMGFPTKKGRSVVYLVGEDQQGTMAHVEAWYKRHNIQLDDNSVRIIFSDKVPDLLSEDDCRLLVTDLQACLPANAEPVIFIDTWQRATAGATQNDDKCMQRAIRNAEEIGRQLGAAIVIAAHPPKGNNGTISGSSIIENSSVAIWDLKADKCNVVVNVDRIKGAGASTEVRIRIEQVEIEGLDDFKRPRTGAVLVSINSPAVSSVLAFPIALSSRESGLLTAMGDHPGASFKELAEKVEWGEPDKPTSSQIRNVMTRLERRGLVRKGENKHYFLTKEGAALPRELQVRQPGLS